MSQTDRLLARNLKITYVRPKPPREPRYSPAQAILSWKPPAGKASAVTHYRVRVDHDSGPPDYELSAGQRAAYIPAGATKAYLSSYNNVSGLESQQLAVNLSDVAGPIPDVALFLAGTAAEDGTFTPKMYWDPLRQRLCTDWAVVAPAGWDNWGGVQICIRSPKEGGGYKYWPGSFPVPSAAFKRSKNGEHYQFGVSVTEPADIPDPPETWDFIAVSLDAAGRHKEDAEGNPIGPIVSLETLPKSDDVTQFTAVAFYKDTEGGQAVFGVAGGWVNPTLPRFKGVRVVMRGYGEGDEILDEKKDGETAYRSSTYGVPSEPTQVDIYAQTIFGDGTVKPIGPTTPKVTLTIAKQQGSQGQEWTANVTNVSVTVTYPETADGTCPAVITGNFTPSALATWGGVELVKLYLGVYTPLSGASGRTSPIVHRAKTPGGLETWRIYFVSYDTNERRNTIVAGVTPYVDISLGTAAGTLKLNRADPDTYELTQFVVYNNRLRIFQVEGNLIVQGTISSDKLDANEIRVGGGGGKPGKLTVWNALGQQIGFIGVEGAYEGGWFYKVRIAGPNVANPVIDADGTAVTINGATFTLTLNNVETKIANFSELGGITGLSMKDVSGAVGNTRALIQPGLIALLGHDSNYNVWIFQGSVPGVLNYGRIQLYNAGVPKIDLDGSLGDITIAGALYPAGGVLSTTAGIGGTGHNTYYDGAWRYGVTQSVAYKKPDDTTGNLWFYGGIFTGVT